MNDRSIQPEEKREAHLLDYWRAIWRGRWTILSIFVVVVTLIAIGTFTQAPVYRAAATVEITPQSRKVSPVADVSEMGTSNWGWSAEERYFNTQYEILKSRDVAQRVFDKLDLYNHPLLRKATDPVGALAKMVQVEPIKDTGIVEISIESTNPTEAMTWVNTIAEAYVERNYDQAVDETKKAVHMLMQQMDPLKERLEDTQRESYAFAEKANLYVPENQQKTVNDRLATLQSDLTDTQVKKGETESILKQIEAVRTSGASFQSIPQISSDPVLQDLYRARVGLERDYQRLLVSYKDKHIRVQEKQSEIEKLNQKITSEEERIISNLQAAQQLLRAREAKLVTTIDETKSESLKVNKKATSFELVRGEATESKRIYDLISARIKEINLSAGLLSNNLKILDKASLPRVPVKPRTLLNMAVGVLLGLLIGIGTVFFLDYMDNTIRSAEDVEQFLGLNLLAIVPKQVAGTESAVKEAYQTLRTSLLFSRKNRSANTVLVSSAGPQEGKSCTAVNVARVLANAGEKVLLLDCDLRRPAVHQRLNLAREHGITNYILAINEDDWTKYLKPTDQPNLSVMTSGPLPPNPADVFGHERFQKLMAEARQQFDWVFVDSPPVISLADTSILSSMVDMVAFVIMHNQNDKEMIRRCINTLKRVNPNVIGAVLNSVDLDRSHFKDYYYVGYYYYGESTTKKGRKRKGDARLTAVTDSGADSRISRNAG